MMQRKCGELPASTDKKGIRTLMGFEMVKGDWHEFQRIIASLALFGADEWTQRPDMSDRIRIIKHEACPRCGRFEVRFPDDRPSQYFYWDDIARRLRRETLDRETALEKAKAVARAARDRS